LSAEIVDKLNTEINACLADSRIKARLADLAATGLVLTPAGFFQFLNEETAKWVKVAQAANIKVE
jgi:tripartite-type tricarboxylate transporter receptor subunit TctC